MRGRHSKVKCVRGPTHDFLGVIYDFSEPGKFKLDMIDYIQQMLDDFSVKFDEKDKVANPAAGDLFEIGNGEFLAENFLKKGISHFRCQRFIFVWQSQT